MSISDRHAWAIFTTLFAVLLPIEASAEDKCGSLQMVSTMQMVRTLDDRRDFVPLEFDLGTKYFLFDTGGSLTQVSIFAVDDMKLKTSQGGIIMRDSAGHASNWIAKVPEFILGQLGSTGATFPVSPIFDVGSGILSLDYLMHFDVDVDFGIDKLNLFSPNHCPGNVLYWTAPAVAVLPLSIDYQRHITVPVTLDGQQLQAVIDTGASNSTLRADMATDNFKLTLGDKDTPGSGPLNGNPKFPTYRHGFKSLTFGDVMVSNPHLTIVPAKEMGSVGWTYASAPVVIGMDVLRHLHLYMAFNEKRLYVSQSSPSPVPLPPYPDSFISQLVAQQSYIITHTHTPADAFSRRCFWRSVAKKDMDAAQDDCEQSIKLAPNSPSAYFYKGFLLYQRGKYQEALGAYDAALKLNAHFADSLFMRGQTKEKLGDSAGRDADIAAAKSAEPAVINFYQRLGVN